MTNNNTIQEITIRKVSLNDIDSLQKIGKQTFVETFTEGNTEENLKKYLEDGFSLEKLTTELNNQYSEFYLAEINNKVIGYLKLNSGQSQTELKDERALEIERIYVLREFHGKTFLSRNSQTEGESSLKVLSGVLKTNRLSEKSVAQMLYQKAIEVAKRLNVDFIWLGVWEKNPRAIRFYKKNGFVEFDKHIFKLGNEEQTDIMMKLNLKDL